MDEGTAKEQNIDAKDIWERAVPIISEKNHRLTHYIKEKYFIGNSGGKIRIAVPNNFCMERINKELQSIQDVVNELSEGNLKAAFEVNHEFCASFKDNRSNDYMVLSEPSISARNVYVNPFYNPKLNDSYTFDGFVKSSENEEAVAFAQMFAGKETPFKRNLYIFGQYGLGKTHLSQACVKLARENGLKSQWVSGEKLKALWSQVYKEHKFDDFNSIFLGNDLLVVDNAQALAGGTGTQKKLLEMMQIYNQEGRRMMITSYLNPQEMRINGSLHENLRGLFVSGLNARIKAPSLETRIEILRKKAELFGAENIDENLLTYLATRLSTETRQLESGIANLVAHAKALNQNYSLSLAEKIVTNLVGQQDKFDEKYIIAKVCEAYGITLNDIQSSKRSAKIVKPRHVAAFLIREQLETPLAKIGEYLGKRTHGTVLHGINEIEEKLKSDNKLRTEIDYIVKQLGLPARTYQPVEKKYDEKKPIQMLIGDVADSMKF